MRKIGWIAAAGVLAASSGLSTAQNNNQVGTLVCAYGTTVGLIVGSRQSLDCTFHARNGDTEPYKGSMGRIELDVGVTDAGRVTWLVFAPSNGLTPRALVGKYVGASGDASVGLGGGANVLVGGSRHTITLQPVSLDAQIGLNLAVGVARLILR